MLESLLELLVQLELLNLYIVRYIKSNFAIRGVPGVDRFLKDFFFAPADGINGLSGLLRLTLRHWQATGTTMVHWHASGCTAVTVMALACSGA